MRILLITACLLALAGCVPVSLHTVCNGSDDYFDPQFLGAWGSADDGVWVFSGGNNYADPPGEGSGQPAFIAYDITYTESGRSSHLKGRLTKIAGVPILDLTPNRDHENNNSDIGGEFIEMMLSLPLHTWVKIGLADGKLDLTPVSLDWLNSELAAHPDELERTYGDDADWPILTGGTDDLRAFIGRHLGDERFFGDMSDLKPLGPISGNSGLQTGNSQYDSQYRSATASTKQTYEQKPAKKKKKPTKHK